MLSIHEIHKSRKNIKAFRLMCLHACVCVCVSVVCCCCFFLIFVIILLFLSHTFIIALCWLVYPVWKFVHILRLTFSISLCTTKMKTNKIYICIINYNGFPYFIWCVNKIQISNWKYACCLGKNTKIKEKLTWNQADDFCFLVCSICLFQLWALFLAYSYSHSVFHL